MTKQFASVWTREPRQPKTSGLRREQIITAAVEILDAEGLESLSMRKLGAKLGAGATSLYWHVANKEELLELVLDQFWGMVQIPEPERASWRELLTTFAYSLRATIRDHSWMASLVGQLPSIGPNSLQLSDRLRRAFVQAGFQGVDIYLASGTVISFVLGQVLPEIAWQKASAEIDTDGMMRVMDELAGDYPDMLADYRATVPTDPEVGRAMAFDFGLLCVLDGLAARLRNTPGSA
ncbi:TetR/AcrR family transcriptional regulator C-terminal domain-containing protein [Nocardia sp. NBC_00508]|uniref:TetR/AcrR family transcriptional regulator C-terminal domain-containing protein n=1 Tax=Nocardia sp. NBC_00508 TaxID=2975992 RepID=UPI002E8126A0|nr:TetR/AcrR family transcriptional regulator C-terminal domain-containing protein [Nocardia sp. NBC_00508]WUD64997.1 TetR/AcrR family transcriptional regulator C-terminal domain-containing protein [Nocardia sp. NBC_00508]